jgi:hypothetical protein
MSIIEGSLTSPSACADHAALAGPTDPSAWQPGDIFTSLVAGTGTHIGLVSNRPGRRSPMIIHNIGAGAREEDALLDWPITGRFRWAVGRSELGAGHGLGFSRCHDRSP